MKMNVNFRDRTEGPPRIVILGIVLFGLLFLSGTIYLFISTPFTGTEIIAPAELPEMSAVLVDFQGTIFGLERARVRVADRLAQEGIAGGNAITIYPMSPLLMRPISVKCRLGYLLAINRPGEELQEPMHLEVLRPGKRLIVRVKGHGNFTGNKAYKAAMEFLLPLGLQPAIGERYEVKVQLDHKDYVEHWIPVK